MLKSLRYPAVPLITHDPYFSVWSFSDKLTGTWPTHWTGAPSSLSGFIRVDGQAYRFCGDLRSVPEMEQLSVEVFPTRTVYTFSASGTKLTLTFLTPALPHNLDILSRPVTYVVFDVEPIDGKEHKVELYFDVDATICVDTGLQKVVWGRFKHSELDLMSVSHEEQRPLNRVGDNLRIDWGNAFMAIPSTYQAQTAIELNTITRERFTQSGTLPACDNLSMPRRANDKWLCMAAVFDCGTITSRTSRHLMLAYNDIWSVEYLNRRLPAYWKRDGMEFGQMLEAANREYNVLKKQCEKYDAMLLETCTQAGGEKYAAVCALAFRQAISAHKLVADIDGTPLFFSKENFSNGCICTVDVTYPSAPLFLLTQPELVKGMMIPIMDYAMTRRWKFPFAPHDLGTYPLANGQLYGGGEHDETDQMPVEECGNMLLLAGALFTLNHEKAFVKKYWTLLTTWANYLKGKGYDPERQLCTDDFAGHLAHNTNLSLKAILALGAYAQMAEALGDKNAAEYMELAQNHAQSWIKDADDGAYFRLAFDRPESWSQKYNLIWDRLLGLNLFPSSIAEKEMAHYRRIQNRYGLPLDNRESYTKLDWITWSAALTGKRDDFEALVNPVFDWLNDSPSRIPMSDWYDTITGKQVNYYSSEGKQIGFQARSVVGGVFIKLLEDRKVIEKWSPAALLKK